MRGSSTGYKAVARCWNRDRSPRAVHWLVAAAIMAGGPGCAFLDKVDKASKIPGLEEAQLKEALEKPPASTGQQSPKSALQVTPSSLDFGSVPVASARHSTIVISNPSRFAVTVVQVTVQGCGFAVSSKSGDRPAIPPQGQLALTLTFQPASRRACQGLLLLEIDSAGGRFTRVVLSGRGV